MCAGPPAGLRGCRGAAFPRERPAPRRERRRQRADRSQGRRHAGGDRLPRRSGRRMRAGPRRSRRCDRRQWRARRAWTWSRTERRLSDTCQVAAPFCDFWDVAIPALLTLDPWKEILSVQEFGTVWDGQPAEQVRVLVEDERIAFLLDEPDGNRFTGAMVRKPFEVELIELLGADELWDQPRFIVPALGPEALCLGEIMLLVQARYAEDEPPNDA